MPATTRGVQTRPLAIATTTITTPSYQTAQPTPRRHASTNTTKTSPEAPEAAEAASAESGGTRSKSQAEQHTGALPDTLANTHVRGRTGGGEPLQGSHSAPPQPKILNAEVPKDGEGPASMTEEQRAEVDEHNRAFREKHDHAAPAADDLVDKKFWQGGGTREDR